MLTDKAQLKKLPLLLRNNEEAMVNQVTKSQIAQVMYLKSVNDAYDMAVSLLDDSTAMNDRYARGDKKRYVAEDILSYIKIGLNMSMQNVRSCYVRVSCLGKMRTHYDSLAVHLDDAPTREVAARFKECMWEYCRKYRSGSARALSKLYSMRLKQEQIKFSDLVRRHQNKLGFNGSQFEDLTQAQKLEVYNNIIHKSSRANIPKLLDMAPSTLGVAVLVAVAGVMVWDICMVRNAFAADSPVARDAFPIKVVLDALAEAVEGTKPGVFAMSLPGFVADVVEGLIIDAASGLLMDMILGTRGTKPLPLTELSFHTALVPDGMALANSIAHAY